MPPGTESSLFLDFDPIPSIIRLDTGDGHMDRDVSMPPCQSNCLEQETPFRRFLFYKLITAVPATAALVAVFRHSDQLIWPILYIAVFLIHVNIMYYAKCPHCPYYRMSSSYHKCFMMWWFPKLYKERSGPTPAFLGLYVPAAILIITLFPVYWLLHEWELLLIYVLSWGVLMGTISEHCATCINFECKFNSVPEDTHKIYTQHNDLRKPL